MGEKSDGWAWVGVMSGNGGDARGRSGDMGEVWGAEPSVLASVRSFVPSAAASAPPVSRTKT